MGCHIWVILFNIFEIRAYVMSCVFCFLPSGHTLTDQQLWQMPRKESDFIHPCFFRLFVCVCSSNIHTLSVYLSSSHVHTLSFSLLFRRPTLGATMRLAPDHCSHLASSAILFTLQEGQLLLRQPRKWPPMCTRHAHLLHQPEVQVPVRGGRRQRPPMRPRPVHHLLHRCATQERVSAFTRARTVAVFTHVCTL